MILFLTSDPKVIKLLMKLSARGVFIPTMMVRLPNPIVGIR